MPLGFNSEYQHAMYTHNTRSRPQTDDRAYVGWEHFIVGQLYFYTYHSLFSKMVRKLSKVVMPKTFMSDIFKCNRICYI